MDRRSCFVVPTLITLAASSAPAQVVIQGIGHLNPGEGNVLNSFAASVSADGSIVVGASRNPDGNQEAIRWTAETGIQGLGHLDGKDFLSSQANAVSADGKVIVGRSRGPSGWEAFRWKSDTGMVGLGDFPDGDFSSQANAVSGNGQVVVGSGRHDPYLEAFHWTEIDGMVGLGYLKGNHDVSYARAISADGTVIAGNAIGPLGDEVFRWTAGTGMTSLGNGAGEPGVFAMSADASTIVGIGPLQGQGFRWTAATGIVSLGEFPGGAFELFVEGVSGDGLRIVGSAATPDFQPFMWSEPHGIRELSQVLIDEYGLELNGWQLEQALDISADGMTIVGVGRNPDGNTEGWVIRLTPSAQDSGACCDSESGSCRSRVLRSACPAPLRFSPGLSCALVPCDAPGIPAVSLWGFGIAALLLLIVEKTHRPAGDVESPA